MKADIRTLLYMLAGALIALSIHPVYGAPFITGDVEASCDTCVYISGGMPPIESPSVIDALRGNPAPPFNNRICKQDASGALIGTNNITLACKNTLWGMASAAIPFTFVRPGSISSPASIRLVP